jgi:hypothetical protein
VITDFARFANSEIALLCGWQGAATHGDLLVGSGGSHEEIARLLEGGVVGHALGAKRVALGPLRRGGYGLGRGAPHDGIGVPAPGFATVDLDADSWR